MRLPIIASAGLLISLSLNVPVMSQLPIQVAESTTESSTITKSDIQQYKKNRRLWNQQNILNYDYTYTNGCFCVEEARGPVVIQVRNGKTTSVTFKGQPVSNPEFFQKYDTVRKLFNVINQAIAHRAYKVDVQYDPTFGYPTQITIDKDAQLADEEIYIGISDFKVIE
ncbi:DUF6174 domain-containing protein [Nostoc sp. UHCC 0302]|uniref:DUF6174 domain-containing protein n=1 Tax=Nostoc sp. UHCC 0302 TaxID=3134896 RepID=UPI00311C9855